MALDPILIGIPEIADLAKVSRAAVSNWRRRYADFPEPQVQTDSGVLFDLREVEAWMLDNGRIDAPVPAGALVWRYSDALRAAWPDDDRVTSVRQRWSDAIRAAWDGNDRVTSVGQKVFDFTSSWLCYLEACRLAEYGPDTEDQRPPVNVADEHRWTTVSAGDDTNLADRLRAAAVAISRANPQLDGVLVDLAPDPFPAARLVRSFVAQLEAAAADQMPFAIFEEAQARATEFSRATAELTTPDCLSHLLARLTANEDVDGDVRIVDPACGTGGLLLMAAVAGDHSPGEVQCIGADVNEVAARHARARFFLYGIRAEIRTEDTLRAPQAIAVGDVVVCDPPYGLHNWGDAALYQDERWRFGPPPPRSADYAWLQLVAASVAENGHGAVLLPAASANTSDATKAIRAHMVDMDVVEAFIQLPTRLRRDTSIPLGIWLLRGGRPADHNERRVLLIDASDLGTAGRSLRELSEDEQDAIVAVVQAWRRDESTDPVGDLVPIVATRDEIWERDVNLTPRRHAPVAPQRSRGAMEQVRAEAHANAVGAANALTAALSGFDVAATPSEEPAHAAPLHYVAEVLRPRPARDERPGLQGQPGDVVITIQPSGVSSRLLEQSETIEGMSSLVLRTRSVDPAWLYLWTRTSAFAALVARDLRGNVVPTLAPRDLREFEILVPPLATQRAAGDLVAVLERATEAASAAADAVQALSQAVSDSAYLQEQA